MSTATQQTAKVIHVLARYLGDACHESPAGRLASGKLLEFHRQHREAIDTYRSVEGKGTETSEAQARLALTLIKSGRAEQALNVAQGLVKQNPRFTFKSLLLQEPVSAYTVLGDAQAASGMQKEALESYQMALKLQAGDTHAAAMGTRISLGLKDLERATRFGSKLTEGQGHDDLVGALSLLRSGKGKLPAIAKLTAARYMDHAV